MWPFKRNPNCWWCDGKGKWTPTNTDNHMGWLEVEEEVECSECGGTGMSARERLRTGS